MICFVDLPNLTSITSVGYSFEYPHVDLPNLTSITSVGYSFEYPHVVTLESISEYWILIVFRYSKSSKCQATWFIQVCRE